MHAHDAEDTVAEIGSVDLTGSDIRPSRVPAAVLLLVLVVWAASSVFLRNVMRLPANVAQLIWGLLIAAIGLSVLPIVRGTFGPERSRVRTLLLRVLIVAFVLPLAFAMLGFARDALHPVKSRSRNELPTLTSLIGATRHDAERMLGDAIQTGEFKTGSGPATVLKGIGAARSVGYALPDLNRLDRRPAKRSELEGDSQQTTTFLRTLSFGSTQSDAQVVVYYSASGKVVGALLEVSRLAVRDSISDVTTATVLRSAGLGEDARYSQGRAIQDGRSLDYYARLDGPAAAQDDLGDVTVFVSAVTGGSTSFATSGLAAARSSASAVSSGVASSGGQAQPVKPVVAGRSSHSDERFWVIVCTDGLTEDAAAREAARLNSRWAARTSENPEPFSVERSGHLQWINMADCWYVIYDIGFGEQDEAEAQLLRLGMPLALEGRVVQITKVCGDPTIAAVQR